MSLNQGVDLNEGGILLHEQFIELRHDTLSIGHLLSTSEAHRCGESLELLIRWSSLHGDGLLEDQIWCLSRNSLDIHTTRGTKRVKNVR